MPAATSVCLQSSRVIRFPGRLGLWIGANPIVSLKCVYASRTSDHPVTSNLKMSIFATLTLDSRDPLHLVSCGQSTPIFQKYSILFYLYIFMLNYMFLNSIYIYKYILLYMNISMFFISDYFRCQSNNLFYIGYSLWFQIPIYLYFVPKYFYYIVIISLFYNCL